MESSSKTAETVFKAFLFTDIVDSTDLKRRFGDEVAARVIAQHDALFRRCLEEHGGHERDNAGDGFLADFDVPSGAIRCALAFIEGLGKIDSPKPLKARVGAHMGETVRLAGEDSSQGAGKLVGLALDTAARVMNLARGSQILITRAIFDSARQQIKTSPSGAPIQWLAHGSYIFKGIGEPLEIFEVGIERLSPLSPPTDSDKASRAVAEGEELILGWRPGAGLNLPNRPHWQIEEKLGMGGFGEIWLVRHQKTNEKRAFKFCFQADRLRGLKREVTLFRLMRETLGNREDITRILDWQFDEAPYFIEAEYTEGGDLLAWAEAQGGIANVSLRTRLKLVAEIAEALAAAHSVGVLHKDLKPSNILIAQTKDAPRAQLTDFGIGLLTDPGL
ncbi:protein kinase, partial [Candidatus Sumerlaeota bacterium]|nr:protein kinase [Candidatus Sumerlaeota bacterium]